MLISGNKLHGFEGGAWSARVDVALDVPWCTAQQLLGRGFSLDLSDCSSLTQLRWALGGAPTIAWTNKVEGLLRLLAGTGVFKFFLLIVVLLVSDFLLLGFQSNDGSQPSRSLRIESLIMIALDLPRQDKTCWWSTRSKCPQSMAEPPKDWDVAWTNTVFQQLWEHGKKNTECHQCNPAP